MCIIQSLQSPVWLYTNDYKIDICSFSSKYTVLRSMSKDQLAQNRDNVFKWSDIPTLELLLGSTIKIQLSVLVEYKADMIIISLKCTSNLFSP